MVIFFNFFCFLRSAEIPIFIVFFEPQTKFAKKKPPPKTITFPFLQNKGSWKKPFCCNPPFYQKLVFFNLVFFETKNKDVEQKHNFKSAKKQREEKGISKRKEDRKPKKRKYWWRKTLYINLSDAVSFPETKAEKKEKERKRQKQGSKRKQKRKTGRRKKGEEEEIDRERKIEKGGGQKNLRRNKGRHSKINQKCPFLGGKQGFFCSTKQRKERNKDKPKKK